MEIIQLKTIKIRKNGYVLVAQVLVKYHKDYFPDPGYLVKYQNGDIEFIKKDEFKNRRIK